MQVTHGKILKYTLLPEVIPRIQTLFTTGFVYIAYLIAIIFQSSRLLPPGHPYGAYQNMGRYKIRDVIIEAWRNLEFKWKNIDQIILFTSICAGLATLALQFVLIALALIVTPSFATVSFADWFVIPSSHYAYDETHDIALNILERVFGVDASGGVPFFNGCLSQGVPCLNHRGETLPVPPSYPFPIHLALHELFRFFSMGISVLSLMVILYLITTMIGETAASGTPFGRRFNRAWAPVRMILFFALLAPLNLGNTNGGLNGAQLITLWTAKWGSNFATNAWGEFHDATGSSWLTGEELVAIPNMPNLGNLSQFWSVVHACMYGEAKRNRDIRIYIVRHGDSAIFGGGNARDITSMATIFNGGLQPAMAFTESAPQIIIRIGVRDEDLYPAELGNVMPFCGEIAIPITTYLDDPTNWGGANPSHVGAYTIQQAFYMLNAGGGGFAAGDGLLGAEVAPIGKCFVNRIYPRAREACEVDPGGRTYEEIVGDHMDNLQTDIELFIETAIDAQIVDANLPNGYMEFSTDLLQRGWGGAAIWYNRIAQMNGELATATFQIPKIKKWPLVMERVQAIQRQNSNNLQDASRFSLILPDKTRIRLEEPGDEYLASAYHRTLEFWESVTTTQQSQAKDPTFNPVVDMINGIFGTAGLINLRHPAIGSSPGNAQVHPLALLSALGKSMVEASIINFGISTAGTLGSGLLSVVEKFSGAASALQTVSSIAGTIGKITILIGGMLFYVLPFLPFIYFFFAITGWIKSIFEAMVAMPLWALAHLRIDGEGLPGPGAANGYYLLLEIFVRPILILIGLIGSIVIMAAMVQALNAIFDLVVENVSGSSGDNPDPTMIQYYREPLDELMYTIVYAVAVYMIATGCFKLIDSVPNNILRWMGSSVTTIQEQAGTQAEKLSSGMYRHGELSINNLRGGQAEVVMAR